MYDKGRYHSQEGRTGVGTAPSRGNADALSLAGRWPGGPGKPASSVRGPKHVVKIWRLRPPVRLTMPRPRRHDTCLRAGPNLVGIF